MSILPPKKCSTETAYCFFLKDGKLLSMILWHLRRRGNLPGQRMAHGHKGQVICSLTVVKHFFWSTGPGRTKGIVKAVLGILPILLFKVSELGRDGGERGESLIRNLHNATLLTSKAWKDSLGGSFYLHQVVRQVFDYRGGLFHGWWQVAKPLQQPKVVTHLIGQLPPAPPPRWPGILKSFQQEKRSSTAGTYGPPFTMNSKVWLPQSVVITEMIAESLS